MIHVVRKDYEIVVEGHAGHSAKGTDIVCAAASILFYTLAEALERRGIEVEADDVENKFIRANPCREFTFDADVVFETVCTGYKLLAEQYPENVSYEDIS